MSNIVAGTRVGEFCASISLALEAEQISTVDLVPYEVDGARPEVVVAPSTVEQLQAVLTEAQTSGVAVIPFGGGTHIGAGNPPAAYDVALSLARLDRITAHEPADLTVTVEPGVRLADLQRVLAAHGQFLPLDPPCDERATIGGVLATNAFGPRRHAFGTARDWLIGIRVVHADGAISKSGGRVVKNVTGYDMHKLYIGSLGTLGVIAEATLKVAPLPHEQSTLAVACRSAAHASDLVLAAHDTGLAIHAAELLSPPASQAVDGASAWTVLVRVAGGPGAVGRSLREVRAASASTGAIVEVRDASTVWDAWNRSFRPGGLSLRIGVLPSRVGDAMQVLDRRLAGAGARLSATATAGVIRASLQLPRDGRAAALVDAARDVAARYDGSVVVDAAPPLVKRDIDVFGPLRPDFSIMKRLKEEFDPKRTLSPGRFVGRL
jgi:glycolate oxidase FAD binding subunit